MGSSYTKPKRHIQTVFLKRGRRIFSLLLFCLQIWGPALGAGITYITWQPYTNPPFLEKGADGKQKTELGGSVF